MMNDELPADAASADIQHSAFSIHPSDGAAVQLPHQLDAPTPEPFTPPIVIDTTGPAPAPFFSLPSSVGGWLFSYAAATVLMGAAILGAWLYKVSLDSEIARDQPPLAQRASAEPKPEYAGRISGTADCHWADPQNAPHTTAVPLGDKYVLNSGLMEITYRTGARVILEGPCTYEVESANGGFLSLGKLTARVESAKPEAANPKSQIPNAKFVVRTPTAIVTDLGTEFGIVVGKHGDVATHVLEGAVDLRVLPHGRSDGQSIRIGANQSVRLVMGAEGQGPTVLHGKADTACFVRPGQLSQWAREQTLRPFRQWETFSAELRKRGDLLAYYDFQPDENDRTVLRNRAATGAALDGRIQDAPWVSGRFPGKDALRFGWPGSSVRLNVPVERQRLTLAAWLKLDYLPTAAECSGSLLMSDGWNRMGAGNFTGRIAWQIANGGRMLFCLDNWKDNVSSRSALDAAGMRGQWRHLAVVYVYGPEASHAAFYVNGEPVGGADMSASVHPTMAAKVGSALIGGWDPDYSEGSPMVDGPGGRWLHGTIDELMIFRSALDAKEIHRIYESTKPQTLNDATSGKEVNR